MKPAVDDLSWSTEMIWLDEVAFLMGFVRTPFDRQGFLVSLLYWQVGQNGVTIRPYTTVLLSK